MTYLENALTLVNVWHVVRNTHKNIIIGRVLKYRLTVVNQDLTPAANFTYVSRAALISLKFMKDFAD